MSVLTLIAFIGFILLLIPSVILWMRKSRGLVRADVEDRARWGCYSFTGLFLVLMILTFFAKS